MTILVNHKYKKSTQVISTTMSSKYLHTRLNRNKPWTTKKWIPWVLDLTAETSRKLSRAYQVTQVRVCNLLMASRATTLNKITDRSITLPSQTLPNSRLITLPTLPPTTPQLLSSNPITSATPLSTLHIRLHPSPFPPKTILKLITTCPQQIIRPLKLQIYLPNKQHHHTNLLWLRNWYTLLKYRLLSRLP